MKSSGDTFKTLYLFELVFLFTYSITIMFRDFSFISVRYQHAVLVLRDFEPTLAEGSGGAYRIGGLRCPLFVRPFVCPQFQTIFSPKPWVDCSQMSNVALRDRGNKNVQTVLGT